MPSGLRDAWLIFDCFTTNKQVLPIIFVPIKVPIAMAGMIKYFVHRRPHSSVHMCHLLWSRFSCFNDPNANNIWGPNCLDFPLNAGGPTSFCLLCNGNDMIVCWLEAILLSPSSQLSGFLQLWFLALSEAQPYEFPISCRGLFCVWPLVNSFGG